MLSALLLLAGCSKPLPTLEGIDLAAFRADKAACQGHRSDFIDNLEVQKEKLKSLSEMEVIRLLGRPDQNELYTRNQKFYKYFLEPGSMCPNRKEKPKELVIRFNAMGLAKEVAVE